MPMAGRFPCHHAGCTLLERHPGLCVFANLSDKRGRRDSTQEGTAASIVQAAQPAVKRKVAPPPKAPCHAFEAVGENQRGSSPACALLVQDGSCNDPATMVPPAVLNSMGAGGAMDPNCIPFPDIGRGGYEDADESGQAAEEVVGTLCLHEGREAASGDDEAPTEGLSAAVRAREGPGQHKPWSAKKQRHSQARADPLSGRIPAGWTEVQHVTASDRKYAVYHGPNGERAVSRVAAWRAAARATEGAVARSDAGEAPPQPGRIGGYEENVEVEVQAVEVEVGVEVEPVGHAAVTLGGGAWVGQAVDVPMAEFQVRQAGTFSGVTTKASSFRVRGRARGSLDRKASSLG